MLIAIEGLDGVGKSTLCDALSRRLNASFIQKPMSIFCDEVGFENYLKISAKINRSDKFIKLQFYGIGNYVTSKMSKNNNIITDRYLVSNYLYNYSKKHKKYLKLLLKRCVSPDLTVWLEASKTVRMARLKNRNLNDADLHKKFSKHTRNKALKFLRKYRFNYMELNTDELNIDDEVEIVLERIKSLNYTI